MIEYAAATSTMSATAVAYEQLHTNYYEGVSHNSVTYRAARGTSASPDYLDTDDEVFGVKTAVDKFFSEKNITVKMCDYCGCCPTWFITK